jgi:hypothetical protein
MTNKTLCVALLLLPFQLFCQTWELIKNRDGIKIYTADSDHSRFKQIKATCITQGTIDEVVSLFQDVEKQPQWVYSTRSAYIISKADENNFLYYVESSLPWPVADRYLVARMIIKENTEKSILSIATLADSSSHISPSGKVRITHFIGKWTIREIGKQQLSIDYFLDIDPGGSLPASIANIFVSKGPYRTLSRLSELLKLR